MATKKYPKNPWSATKKAKANATRKRNLQAKGLWNKPKKRK